MSEEELSQAENERTEVQADGAQDAQSQEFSAEYVQQLRREAAGYRKRLRELEAAVKGYEEAQMSESERLQARLSELERQYTEAQRSLQESTLRYEVMLAAGRLGVVDADAAWRLLDASSIEFDDDGRPTNVVDVLRELVRQRPYLAAGTAVTGAVTNPARPRSTVLTLDEIRRMTPDEINERWDEVQRALSENK